MNTVLVLCAGLAVMMVSISGVLFTRGVLGTWMRLHIGYLTSFATGVIVVLSYHLVSESIEESMSLLVTIGAGVAGFVLMELVHWLTPEHEHCETSHDHSLESSHAHTPIDGRRVLFSDAVHNISDGFVLVPAFVAGISVGVVTTFAIMAHELVQEVSKFFVLKEAGYSDRQALTRNFISSSTILVGIVLAMLFSAHDMFLSVMGALAAGGFMAVLVQDLIPHVFSELRTTRFVSLHILAIVAGAVLMLTATTLAPHEHNHEVESVHVSTLR